MIQIGKNGEQKPFKIFIILKLRDVFCHIPQQQKGAFNSNYEESMRDLKFVRYQIKLTLACVDSARSHHRIFWINVAGQ